MIINGSLVSSINDVYTCILSRRGNARHLACPPATKRAPRARQRQHFASWACAEFQFRFEELWARRHSFIRRTLRKQMRVTLACFKSVCVRVKQLLTLAKAAGVHGVHVGVEMDGCIWSRSSRTRRAR